MQVNTSQPEGIGAEAGLRKRICFILLFYSASALGIYLLEKWESGGPCGIGLGMFSLFFLFIPVSAGMALHNLKSVSGKGKSYFITTALHIICLTAVLKLFW